MGGGEGRKEKPDEAEFSVAMIPPNPVVYSELYNKL